MILWRGREEAETRHEADGTPYPCDAFRWTFQASASRGGLSAGFVHQHRFRSSGLWQDSHVHCYELALMPAWRWGRAHLYYDGPHCSLSVGFLRVLWGGLHGNCDICRAEEEAPPETLLGWLKQNLFPLDNT